MTTTARIDYRNGQRVAIDIDGILYPGQITTTYGDGTYFAKLADGTLTGAIPEDRIVSVQTIAHNDHLVVLDAHRAQNHSVSSLSGYGKQYDNYDGPNGMARYMEDLKRNSGKAVWITAEATVISAYREPLVKRVKVQSGDFVWFDSATPGEGGWYQVALPGRYGGDHCRLVRP
jgi:hypothetical protein